MRRFTLILIAALLLIGAASSSRVQACDPDPNASFLIMGELPGGG